MYLAIAQSLLLPKFLLYNRHALSYFSKKMCTCMYMHDHTQFVTLIYTFIQPVNPLSPYLTKGFQAQLFF